MGYAASKMMKLSKIYDASPLTGGGILGFWYEMQRFSRFSCNIKIFVENARDSERNVRDAARLDFGGILVRAPNA